jgi:hypothetical protein
VEAPNDALVASLQAEPRGDTVYFSLRVTNPGDASVELTFPTGQTYDFVVEHGEDEVWQWSDGRAFTQAVRHVGIEGGATEVYEAEWIPPDGTTGAFRVRGFLTALEERLEQQTQFHLP